MFKRNDGYALSYVLVVLMVLAIIATAVMAPPLRNLQLQQASIERMQDKYIAQGMVEQVVAQLDNIDTLPTSADLSNLPIYRPDGCSFAIVLNEIDKYTITATSKKTIITAKVLLSRASETDKYSLSYISYNTEVGS